jgi:hypothetical protein
MDTTLPPLANRANTKRLLVPVESSSVSWVWSLRNQTNKEPRLDESPRRLKLPPVRPVVLKDLQTESNSLSSPSVDALATSRCSEKTDAALATLASPQEDFGGTFPKRKAATSKRSPKANAKEKSQPVFHRRMSIGRRRSSVGRDMFSETMLFWRQYAEHEVRKDPRNPAWHEAEFFSLEGNANQSASQKNTRLRIRKNVQQSEADTLENSDPLMNQTTARKESPRRVATHTFSEYVIEVPLAPAAAQTAVMQERRERLEMMLRAGQLSSVREETEKMAAASIYKDLPESHKDCRRTPPFRPPKTREEELADGIFVAIRSMAAQRRELAEARNRLAQALEKSSKTSAVPKVRLEDLHTLKTSFTTVLQTRQHEDA